MWFRQVLRLQSISRQNFRVQVKYEIHLCPILTASAPARSRKNGYYEILGVSANSRNGDIKAGYMEIVKKHHPDRAGPDNAESKAIFEEATEAYQFLMEPTQRYFYDRNGFPSDPKKNRNQSSSTASSAHDFDPKYNIYRNRRSDEEQTRKEYEEWIKSQGHSGHAAQKINMKQKFKNTWVEWRYGFKYYDFPWEIKSFFQTLLAVSCAMGIVLYAFKSYIKYYMADVKVARLNDMTRNPEIALQSDILGAAGIRNYSNSPFYGSTNRKFAQQDSENSTLDEPLPMIEIGKKSKKLRNWKETRKEKEERIESEKESRKERRIRVQKELEEYKISHRMGVLRDRLRVLDSEADIVGKEIRRLESRLPQPPE